MVVKSESSPRFGDELVLFMYQGVGVVIVINFSIEEL